MNMQDAICFRGFSRGHGSHGAWLCAAVLLLGGCAERRAPGFPWHVMALGRPKIPASAPLAEMDSPPDLKLLIPEESARLVPPRMAPRPHSASGSDNAEANRQPPPTTPQLLPQLTAEESAAAQRQTEESLAIADRNLNSALRHTLSAAQTDLAAKIKSFMEQAREAARGGDWVGARNLAQKAQLLSEELIRSL